MKEPFEGYRLIDDNNEDNVEHRLMSGRREGSVLSTWEGNGDE